MSQAKRFVFLEKGLAFFLPFKGQQFCKMSALMIKAKKISSSLRMTCLLCCALGALSLPLNADDTKLSHPKADHNTKGKTTKVWQKSTGWAKNLKKKLKLSKAKKQSRKAKDSMNDAAAKHGFSNNDIEFIKKNLDFSQQGEATKAPDSVRKHFHQKGFGDPEINDMYRRVHKQVGKEQSAMNREAEKRDREMLKKDRIRKDYLSKADKLAKDMGGSNPGGTSSATASGSQSNLPSDPPAYTLY